MKNRAWLYGPCIVFVMSHALVTDVTAARIYNENSQALQVCGHGAFSLYTGAGSECVTVARGERSASIRLCLVNISVPLTPLLFQSATNDLN